MKKRNPERETRQRWRKERNKEKEKRQRNE